MAYKVPHQWTWQSWSSVPSNHKQGFKPWLGPFQDQYHTYPCWTESKWPYSYSATWLLFTVAAQAARAQAVPHQLELGCREAAIAAGRVGLELGTGRGRRPRVAAWVTVTWTWNQTLVRLSGNMTWTNSVVGNDSLNNKFSEAWDVRLPCTFERAPRSGCPPWCRRCRCSFAGA